MRNLLSFCIMLCFSLGVSAQNGTDMPRGNATQSAPKLVEQKFQIEFPKASNVLWEKTANRYLANFTMNGFTMHALYTSAGLWLLTNIDVPLNKIPQEALEHRKANFGDFSISKTGFFDSTNKGSYYYFILKKNGATRKAKYDDKGNFLGVE